MVPILFAIGIVLSRSNANLTSTAISYISLTTWTAFSAWDCHEGNVVMK